MNIIAQKLKLIGKSQSWLARKTGLDRFYINKIVHNKIKHPSINYAYKIAKVLDSKIEEIWILE